MSNFILILVLLSITGCSSNEKLIGASSQVVTAEKGNTTAEVKQLFVDEVVSKWNKYAIVENVDAKDQYGYLNLFVAENKLLKHRDTEARHLEFKPEDHSLSIDLSIFRLSYPSEVEAIEAVAETWGKELTGTIPDGKVLTRYTVKISGNVIIVLGTLSILDPDVTNFFDTFASKL